MAVETTVRLIVRCEACGRRNLTLYNEIEVGRVIAEYTCDRCGQEQRQEVTALKA